MCASVRCIMTYTEDGGCRLFRNLGVIIQTTAIQVLAIKNLKPFTVLPAIWMWNLVLPYGKICEPQTLQACFIIITQAGHDLHAIYAVLCLESSWPYLSKRTQHHVVHWPTVAVYRWYQMVACCSIRWSLGRDKSYTFHLNLRGFPPVTQGSPVTMQCSFLATQGHGDKSKRCQSSSSCSCTSDHSINHFGL